MADISSYTQPVLLKGSDGKWYSAYRDPNQELNQSATIANADFRRKAPNLPFAPKESQIRELQVVDVSDDFLAELASTDQRNARGIADLVSKHRIPMTSDEVKRFAQSVGDLLGNYVPWQTFGKEKPKE